MKPFCIISIAICILFTSCSVNGQTIPPILLIKDKDGIYKLDTIGKKEKLIYKVASDLIINTGSIIISNGTLTFGIVGKFLEDSFNSELYEEKFYTIDLCTGKNWLSGIRSNNVINNKKQLRVIFKKIDPEGKIIEQSDTTVSYKGLTSGYKGVIYNEFKPRFFSESVIGNKKVFSSRGSIYYSDKSDTTLLVSFTGKFDPKFGNGYLEPLFDPTGQYIICRYLPGAFNFRESECLYIVDTKTKEKKILKKGEFRSPSFSKNGKLLLFQRNGRFDQNECWINDIYILDMKTLKERKVGVSNFAIWLTNNQ